ncbi:B12-binding domain-containing radical SAM protein [bacterium]|nr:B12-binding domain-containing radical SAM protein [bacterium]
MKTNSVKKIVFLEPRGSYSNVFAQYMSIPMLGPLYLGTIAEQAGYDVLILNENILGREVRSGELKDTDILCLSCMTTTIDRGRDIARQYKKVRTSMGLDSWTIVGGIHASMIPEDVVNDFDQVFVGEAETRILDLLSGKINDKIVYGERIKDLDSIPIPNFKLIKKHEKVKVHPVMTSRGCPYDCTFCSVTEMFGRGYRVRSVGHIMKELKALQTDRVFFVDDHFALKKNRTENLMHEMDTNDIRVKWSCQLRAESGKDGNLVRRMRETGCQTVYVGFESINPESLKEMKKNQTLDDIRNSIKVFKDNNINIHGMFMLGNDSDDKGIFKSTSQFCKESGLTSVQYMIITPLPGTVFYRKIEEEGRLLHKNWQFYDALHVVFQPKNFTPSELQEGMIDCFEEFYNYTGALNEALVTFFKTGGALIKSTYKSVKFPSLSAPVVKLVGKRIVKRWKKFNRPYFGYLNIISLGSSLKD